MKETRSDKRDEIAEARAALSARLLLRGQMGRRLLVRFLDAGFRAAPRNLAEARANRKKGISNEFP